MKKRILIPTIALVAILGAVTVGTVSVSAQSPMYGNLVTAIAQRFNLKESDVQDVINQVRTEKLSEHQTAGEARLSELVKEGKITESQKQSIIAKQTEIKNQLQGLKDLSPAERKTKIEQIETDLKKWAADNKIDLKFVRPMGIKPWFKRGFSDGHSPKKSN